jgi:hypothetical protein
MQKQQRNGYTRVKETREKGLKPSCCWQARIGTDVTEIPAGLFNADT